MGEAPKLYVNKPRKAHARQPQQQQQLKSKEMPSSASTSADSSSMAGQGSVKPPAPPRESFARRYKFLWPLLLTVNLAVGAYLFMRTKKKDVGEEDAPNAGSSSFSHTAAPTPPVPENPSLPLPVAEPLKLPEPIPENQQHKLFEWMLEEKRKIKPKDADEKKRIGEEKAILKSSFVQVYSDYLGRIDWERVCLAFMVYEIGYCVEMCTHVALCGNDMGKLGLDTKGQPLTGYNTIIQPFPTLTQHHESCCCCHRQIIQLFEQQLVLIWRSSITPYACGSCTLPNLLISFTGSSPSVHQREENTERNGDGETFISADDLRINPWNLETGCQRFNIVDVKPPNMEDLTGKVWQAASSLWWSLPNSRRDEGNGQFVALNDGNGWVEKVLFLG
ncbi:hypothetical protein Nepgr_019452 [Nepenthes gracilis]|uniref:Uncharacterized protein n=1 Tax=Nepenthes gracilis TaxID=150966 RepID=A0AAD3XVC3_NEPGR|nr:hypothetical protein Nepgr_019452 [Nepenthes gracilis]